MKPAPESEPFEPFDAEGLEQLVARAERDPAASAELDFLADVVAAAELERARLTLRPAPPARVRPLRTWLVPAVASVLFLFALGLWYANSQRRASRALELGAPRYVESEVRGGDDELGAAFERAMEPYARGDWRAAVQALEALLARHPEHGPSHFYLAAALEQLGELARAEGEYECAATSPDALLAAHARLRLALAWLRDGERARARAALTALRDEGGELAGYAREWLETLER